VELRPAAGLAGPDRHVWRLATTARSAIRACVLDEWKRGGEGFILESLPLPVNQTHALQVVTAYGASWL